MSGCSSQNVKDSLRNTKSISFVLRKEDYIPSKDMDIDLNNIILGLNKSEDNQSVDNLDSLLSRRGQETMDRIYTTIKEISKETRNAKHPKSMDAFYYMREQYEAIAKASGNPNITINTKPLKNKKYILPNLIVKIKGKKSFNRSIIIGSHFDSRVYNNINTMAPGRMIRVVPVRLISNVLEHW